MNRNRIRMRVFLLTTVMLVLILVGVVYINIMHAFAAERTLHAVLLVTDLLKIYVDNNKSWPQSWQDLESLPTRQRAMYLWPQDSKDIQSRVAVNFMVNLDDIKKESVETFDLVKPTGPCYPYNHYPEIAVLLDSIKYSVGVETARDNKWGKGSLLNSGDTTKKVDSREGKGDSEEESVVSSQEAADSRQ